MDSHAYHVLAIVCMYVGTFYGYLNGVPIFLCRYECMGNKRCVTSETTYTFQPTCCEGFASAIDAGVVNRSVDTNQLLRTEGCPIGQYTVHQISFYLATSVSCVCPLNSPCFTVPVCLWVLHAVNMVTLRATCVLQGIVHGNITIMQAVSVGK